MPIIWLRLSPIEPNLQTLKLEPYALDAEIQSLHAPQLLGYAHENVIFSGRYLHLCRKPLFDLGFGDELASAKRSASKKTFFCYGGSFF